jgi:hypothetical protein
MTVNCYLKRWLPGPPITGRWALVCMVAAVAVPTFVRASVDGMVADSAFIPYFPFVLLSAILLGWRHAAAVAVASAIVADLLFVDPRFIFMAGPTDVFGIIIFLASSVLAICLVNAIRSVIQDGVSPPGSGDGIIFSLERGQAWASWRGANYYLRLGQPDEVAEMMKDYLAQLELGKRLNRDPQ